MNKIFTLSILFTFFTVNIFSQITNTRKWRGSENDSMQNASFLMDEEKYVMALPLFENLYNSHPNEDYLKYCYGKCGLYRSDKHETALQLLTEVYNKNKKVNNIELDLAKANHYNYKFDEALSLLEKYLSKKKLKLNDKKQALQLREYCINAKDLYSNPTAAKVTNAGPVLNSKDNEYVPVISADESTLIFTYSGKESVGGLQNDMMLPDPYGMYYEDIFTSHKENNEWVKPTTLSTINTNMHDAAIALSADGMTLFTYKDIGDDHGDIYISKLVNGSWTTPVKLKGQVNSYSWEGSCSMTPDGKNLYFSSERGGGFGGRDIYRATLLADSTWGNVINLGDSINTALDDDSPFIHPDGVTLFYSSKGKNSMGDYDIFQSRMNLIDSTFSKPINLGYPVNTPDGDRFYVLSANSEKGYYASGKSGGNGLQDIYSVEPGFIGKKPSLYVLKGKITSDGTNAEADIKVEITSKQNKHFGTFKSNSVDGNYLISIPSGAEFKVTYHYKTFQSKTLEINTVGLEGYDEKVADFAFDGKDTVTLVVTEPKIDSASVAVVSPPTEEKNPVKQPVPVAVKEPVVAKEPVVKEPVVVAPSGFVKPTPIQSKTQTFGEKYGDISAEGLEFKIQVAAFKYPKNYVNKKLDGLGTIENLLLEDGVTRIMIGGSFKTLNEAIAHSKKVMMTGQKDAFVTVIYRGRRVYLEDLEKMGIYVKK